MYINKRKNTYVKIDQKKHIRAVNLLLGIRAIFNLFKHDMSLNKLFKVEYVPPKVEGGLYFQKIVFISIQEIDIKKLETHAEKAPFISYNKFLEEREVINVLSIAIRFLEEFNRENNHNN
ncbi:hypothetical protein A0U40_17650 [[Bacillus] sp. KCTC 13219]|nr:hypothetical protein A0U40_17650 [[Bacillus] sp. KCTC 13219]